MKQIMPEQEFYPFNFRKIEYVVPPNITGGLKYPLPVFLIGNFFCQAERGHFAQTQPSIAYLLLFQVLR